MNSIRHPGKVVEQGVTVLALGEAFETIDETVMDFLRTELKSVATEVTPPRLVLDMQGVTFFGSSFIELLFIVSKKLTERKGTFALCNLTSHCAEVLHITHLDHVWTIRDSRTEAVDAIKG